ncbi:MAG: outer membrane lipoprotein chaperone LolA, partial [bacterium]
VEAKRPNLLRWETLSPMEQLIVGDGEKIWLYDPDLLQVTVQNYPENVAETPAMLLIGQFEGLRDNYDITVLDSDVSTTLYQLQPRDHSGQFSLIILGVSEGVPVSLSMTDALQQVTRIEFAEVAIDRELSPPLFHFELPEGVDLIRNDN